jgi:hypothetical protein
VTNDRLKISHTNIHHYEDEGRGGRKGGREGGREEEAIEEEGFGFVEEGRDDTFVDWLARGREGGKTRWGWR